MYHQAIATYDRRVSLKEDVECGASNPGVTLGGTGNTAIGVQGSVSHIAIGAIGGLQVSESFEIVRWSGSIRSRGSKWCVAQEAACGVRAGDWSSSSGLRRTRVLTFLDDIAE